MAVHLPFSKESRRRIPVLMYNKMLAMIASLGRILRTKTMSLRDLISTMRKSSVVIPKDVCFYSIRRTAGNRCADFLMFRSGRIIIQNQIRGKNFLNTQK